MSGFKYVLFPTTLPSQACGCGGDLSTQLLREAPRFAPGFRRVPEPRPQHAAAHRDVFRERPSARPHARYHSAAGPARPCDRCGASLINK